MAMRVLVAEDDAVAARIACRVLEREGYEVTLATDGLSAWEAVLTGHFDLLVSDWMMPGMDGLELVQRIRATGGTRYLYVVLVTALSDIEDLLRGLEAGADDYVAKPYHPDELAARVRVGARIVDLHDQLRSAQLALHANATVDPAFGIHTQRAIMDTVRAELARVEDSGRSMSVVRFSVRRTQPNGEEAPGIDLVRAVAAAIVERKRPYDSIGRCGGADPFAGVVYMPGELLVVLPGRADAEARAWATEVSSRIERTKFEVDGASTQVALHVGVASIDEAGTTAVKLVAAAERDLGTAVSGDIMAPRPAFPAA